MREQVIALRTDSGETVLDLEQVAAVTTRHDEFGEYVWDIHLKSGTIFTSNDVPEINRLMNLTFGVEVWYE
tara:strand:+ start:3831 stop:4043 length:213 start_codon:yes stop_codon:yes gene_type:complete